MAQLVALCIMILLAGTGDAARMPDILGKALGWGPARDHPPAPPNFPDSYEVSKHAINYPLNASITTLVCSLTISCLAAAWWWCRSSRRWSLCSGNPGTTAAASAAQAA